MGGGAGTGFRRSPQRVRRGAPEVGVRSAGIVGKWRGWSVVARADFHSKKTGWKEKQSHHGGTRLKARI